jgi:hypothetical protein
MKIQRLTIVLLVTSIALTLINSVFFGFALIKKKPSIGETQAILRGSGLEIVDEQGRLRAQIIVEPESTSGGQKYPETVLFRLITPNGSPAVKIGASIEGSGISLENDTESSEWSGIQILAKGKDSVIILTNRNGEEKLIQP